MLREERQERIVELVRERKTCSTTQLQTELDVSRVTLYRDLKDLGEKKLISRVHGGVLLGSNHRIETRFSVRLRTQTAPKERIGQYARELVNPGLVMFVDASSTCYIFVQQLLAMAGSPSRLTLVTNSPQIPLELEIQPHIRVISTGGELLHQANAFGGPLAVQLLSKLHFDAAFLSCAGISATTGATTNSPLLAEVLTMAASSSDKIHLLVDSSKFLKRGMLTALPLGRIHHIITDSGAPEEELAELSKVGTKVTVV
ncbi:MAG: DeoR/GlpR family DNA-binding transcription regulator [Acidobacteriota bacterium]